MPIMNYYSNQKLTQDIEKVMNKVTFVEKDALRDFVTYWLIRKIDPFKADDLIKQMTTSDNWFNIIESNNKFRVKYGEEIANKIIKIIEEEHLKDTRVKSKK